MKYSSTIKTARLQVVIDKLNAVGSVPNPLLKVYAGTEPAFIDAITDQVLLVELVLTAPVNAAAIVDGSVAMKDLPEAMVAADGTASFARLYDANEVLLAQLDIAELNADLTGTALTFYSGAFLRTKDWVLSES